MVSLIEYRKLQKTGGSSFIISLPKGWIIKHELKVKDTLGILTQPDGNLLIIPHPRAKDIVRTKTIDLDDITSFDFLFRLLIGAYIVGYSTIKVISSRKIDPSLRRCVIHFTQITIGPEIIEESENVIIIKDLVSPKEMPFDKTIKRMFILVESMHEDVINALSKEDVNLAEEVIKRDNDIDRLHWLVGRQMNIVLRDIILSQKMGIALSEAPKYQQISRYLERIADHAVKIAKNVKEILNHKLNEENKEKISIASKLSLEMLNRSLDAWLQKDLNFANENIESIKDLNSACEDISIHLMENDVKSSIPISYIVESIRRTGEYAVDISEIIINDLM